jgi:hypothetical protein
LSLGDFQQYAVLASLLYIYANIAWVGVVRPALMVILNLWVPVRSHSSWPLMLVATLVTGIVPVLVVIDYYRSSVRRALARVGAWAGRR